MEASFKVGPVFLGRKLRHIPHSLNHRLHWAQRRAWKQKWFEQVWAEVQIIKPKFKFELPLQKAAVTVILRTCHDIDRDNAYTAAKPIVDGLVYAGLIIDDRQEFLDLEVKTLKVRHLDEQGVDVKIKTK